MTASHVTAGGQFIGAPVLRHEDARLVRGQGTFLDDVAVRDMLHVAFVRSDRAHARLVSVDTGRARGLPGVVAAYSTRDLPWTLPPLPESAVTAQVAEANPYADRRVLRENLFRLDRDLQNLGLDYTRIRILV